LTDAHYLVVDGRSTDRTAEIAKNIGAQIILQDGLGKGDAIAKALKAADLNDDYVVFIAADFTYPAQYIPEMIQILEENPHVGMVLGNRFNNALIDSKALDSIFYLGNRLIAITQNLLNGILLHDPLSGLRVVRSEILKDWEVKSKSFDIEVELNHLVERKGYSIAEIPISYRPRIGQKKLRVTDGAVILKRILSEAAY
jgi:dolichol-phosphate mannosyltransferase